MLEGHKEEFKAIKVNALRWISICVLADPTRGKCLELGLHMCVS